MQSLSVGNNPDIADHRKNGSMLRLNCNNYNRKQRKIAKHINLSYNSSFGLKTVKNHLINRPLYALTR